MFKGDIDKFSPADLLTFLAHLGKEGILTVTNGGDSLSVSFKGGRLVDASSDGADAKVLGAIYARGLIDKSQFDSISRARRETNLPLRQILEDSDGLTMSSVSPMLEDGIKETLFQLLLWEVGEFQFAEILVDQSNRLGAHECESLTLEIARRVDEYREYVRSRVPAEACAVVTPSGRDANTNSAAERFILSRADGKNVVKHILRAAPFTEYDAMKAMDTCVTSGWIELRKNDPEAVPAAASGSTDGLFFSFKRSLRKIIMSRDSRSKITEAISFCKDHFGYVLVIASKNSDVVRCMRFYRNDGGRLAHVDIQNAHARIDTDPIFEWTYRTKSPFFGSVFPSTFFNELGESPPDGDCAVVPLGNVDGDDLMVYVGAPRRDGEPGALHYLELLSWHLHPPAKDPQPKRQTGGLGGGPRKTEPAPDTCEPGGRLDRMINKIKEIPPMPNVVARIFQLLSDPDSGTPDITEVLARDPALVARLIKVSNSALYGRGQKISTLNQAVVRLGTRTIRSIVLAASTRSLFPMDQTGIGIWGQALWQHSVECGLASRRVAELVRYTDPEEAFVGGVLHDIGKVVLLLNLPDEFRRIRQAQTAGSKSSVDAERDVLGFDHTTVGVLLLEKWQLPQSLTECVRCHHQPQQSDGFETLAHIIACGNYLSHVHGTQLDMMKATDTIDISSITRFLDISADQMEMLNEKIPEDFAYSAMLD